MDLVALVHIGVKVSILLIVLGIALEASPRDVTHLLRRPGLFIRSLLAMNVIMPVLAAVLVATFMLNKASEIALVALAVSPVPPILPRKQLKAGGSQSYTIGLFVAAAALSIIVVPLELKLLGQIFGFEAHPAAAAIARVVVVTVLAPLAVGLLVRHFLPGLAARLAKLASLLGAVILGLSAAVILVGTWSAMTALIGDGTLLAITAFVVVGLAVGHLLGGPDPDERTVLAFSTASRHPGVALAIAAIDFSDEKNVLAAVLLYLIWSAIVSVPYLAWRKRQLARAT